MGKTRLFAAVLCVIMLFKLMPSPSLAADTIINVSTATGLRAALENNAGAHVRLIKDVTFTTGSAFDRDFGVYLGEGIYTVDLNGFTLKYSYRTGGELSDKGVPMHGGRAKLLVINGPGTMVGGTHGLEQGNQFGSLIVNGGTFKGVMGYGIRVTGGIAYINGGTVTGNFGSIEHADGIVVLNGDQVKSVRQTDPKAKKRGLVKDGVFTGNTVLEDVVLYVDKLTIAKGASMKLIRGGGLVVNGSFVNNGTFIHEAGLKSIGGEAIIKPDTQGNHTPVHILFDRTFGSLTLLERSAMYVWNGATVTVTGAFKSEKNSLVSVNDGTLRLLGSVDHKGHADGVPELDTSAHAGPQRGFERETDIAIRLNALGLFQGVGTNPDGGINFDLERAPSRAEAVVMLIRLLGKEKDAKEGGWTHPFTDVPGWADKYVGYAYTHGLTNGVSATRFGTDTASCQMYLTFVLRSLGYSDAGGGDFTWDRPEELARETGILPEGVHMESFLRADVALISEAALSARLKNSRDTLLDKLIADGAVSLTNTD